MRSATTKADMGQDLVAAEQGDVLDEEPGHTLALALGDVRVTPESREVGRQGGDLLTLLVAEQAAVSLPLPLVVLLGISEGSQLVVPVRLQH